MGDHLPVRDRGSPGQGQRVSWVRDRASPGQGQSVSRSGTEGLLVRDRASPGWGPSDREVTCGKARPPADLVQLPGADGQFLQEVLWGAPGGDAVGLLDVLGLGPLQDGRDVLLWVLDLLHLDLRRT